MHSMQWSVLWPKSDDGLVNLLIVDEFVNTTNRPRIWRIRRDRAIADWEASGVFRSTVEEREPDPDPDKYLFGAVRVIAKGSGLAGVYKGGSAGVSRVDESGEFWSPTDPRNAYVTGGLIKTSYRRRTFSHELGHILGLKHRKLSLATSVMSYIFRARHPDAHDLESVQRMYAGIERVGG